VKLFVPPPGFSATDFLNPILVKELRQGIRGTVFTGAFLLLHVLMLFASAVSLLLHGEGAADRSFSDACFWFLIAIPILLILPLSAGASLNSERTSNTLEPLLLTRLGPREIVFGKWASVVVQTALFISAVLPYVVLRYFLGGVNLLSELLGLVDLWLCSTILTAIAVAVAVLRASALFRWLLWFAVSAYIAGQLQIFVTMAAPIFAFGRFDAAVLSTTLAIAGLIVWIFLEVGGLQIAPAAEVRSWRLRLLAIAAALLAVVADELVTAGGPAHVVATARVTLLLWTLTIVLFVVAGSVCEDLKDIPGLYAPFLRRRGPLRWLCLPFAPGWPFGTLYAAALLPFVVAFTWSHVAAENRPVVFTALLASVFFPLALLRVVLRSRFRTFRAYLVLQTLSIVPVLTFGLAKLTNANMLAEQARVASAVLPLSALILQAKIPYSVVFLGAVTTVSVAALLVEGIRVARSLSEQVRQSLALPQATPPS
jgi:hypothetical protein